MAKLYDKIKLLYDSKLYLPDSFTFDVNVNKIMKSFIGHLLAMYFPSGKTVYEVLKSEPVAESIFDEYRDFFLNDNNINERFDFYYWYYPFHEIKLYPYYSYSPNGIENIKDSIYGTLFKFFPFGLFIVDKQKSSSSLNFKKLTIEDKSIKIDLNKQIPYDLFENPGRQGVSLFDFSSVIIGSKKIMQT